MQPLIIRLSAYRKEQQDVPLNTESSHNQRVIEWVVQEIERRKARYQKCENPAFQLGSAVPQGEEI
jgi:GTP-dependent phosphoenolpyruvate carboxykinase